MAGTVARGDVRLCQLAPPDKKMPVVVLTRDRRYLLSFEGYRRIYPINHRGVPSVVVLNDEDGIKAPCAVNL